MALAPLLSVPEIEHRLSLIFPATTPHRNYVIRVFVEVVASDGPMHERRRAAFGQLAAAAGFTPRQVAFGTAFRDRDSVFKKSAGIWPGKPLPGS